MSSIAPSPRRIQRKRTRGWRMPEGAVYVGRGAKSGWGNPWRVGAPHPIHGWPMSANEAVALYREQFDRGWWSVQLVADELVGRDLACWCPLDQPCHADVLLDLANGDVD